MTASSAVSTDRRKLPLWRLIAGFAVLGILAALLITAALVYLDNSRLDRYMRALADAPASAQLPDATLKGEILRRAADLGLSLQPGDVEISRPGGRPHITITKYSARTPIAGMDLRLPEASSH